MNSVIYSWDNFKLNYYIKFYIEKLIVNSCYFLEFENIILVELKKYIKRMELYTKLNLIIPFYIIKSQVVGEIIKAILKIWVSIKLLFHKYF